MAYKRLVQGTVTVDGTDDEWWPQQDETVQRSFTVKTILDPGQPAAKVEIPHVRWGGECRVELDLYAKALDTGAVQVEATGRLYEGTSESTGDLEDTKVTTFNIPKKQTSGGAINLVNTETGGGDHAEIRIWLSNYAYVDE